MIFNFSPLNCISFVIKGIIQVFFLRSKKCEINVEHELKRIDTTKSKKIYSWLHIIFIWRNSGSMAGLWDLGPRKNSFVTALEVDGDLWVTAMDLESAIFFITYQNTFFLAYGNMGSWSDHQKVWSRMIFGMYFANYAKAWPSRYL